MTVLTDGYTPPREELTRIENLRTGEPHKTGGSTRGSLHDHEPDLTPVRGTHELHQRPERPETEPHGMYWVTGQDGSMFLRPHPWFVRQIAVNAEHVFQITRETLGTDPDIVSEYTSIGDSLRDYIEARAQLNEMVRARKVRQELDDAAYQFCQAAKYKIDAEERAKYLVSRDEDPLDNEQINALIERAQQAAHEGFILAYAIQHAGYPSYMDFATAAKRVLDYSCKRLTEWFAQRRRNTQQQNQLSISATLSMINNMFVRGTR